MENQNTSRRNRATSRQGNNQTQRRPRIRQAQTHQQLMPSRSNSVRSYVTNLSGIEDVHESLIEVQYLTDSGIVLRRDGQDNVLPGAYAQRTFIDTTGGLDISVGYRRIRGRLTTLQSSENTAVTPTNLEREENISSNRISKKRLYPNLNEVNDIKDITDIEMKEILRKFKQAD